MRNSLRTRLKLFKKLSDLHVEERKETFFWFQLTNYQVDANTINNFLSTSETFFNSQSRAIIFQMPPESLFIYSQTIIT